LSLARRFNAGKRVEMLRVAQRRLKRIGIQASLRDADTARIFPALKRRAKLNRR